MRVCEIVCVFEIVGTCEHVWSCLQHLQTCCTDEVAVQCQFCVEFISAWSVLIVMISARLFLHVIALVQCLVVSFSCGGLRGFLLCFC